MVKNIFKITVITGLVGILAGCGSTFRDREFDYARQNVNLRPALVVPKNVSENPDISSVLPIQGGEENYKPEKPETVKSHMTPPDFQTSYSLDLLEAKAIEAKPVEVDLQFSQKNAGLMTVFEPQGETWKLVMAALPKINGFVMGDQNQTAGTVALMDTKTQKHYLLYLSQKEKDTQITVFTMKNQVATDLVAANLLESLKSQLTQETVLATGAGNTSEHEINEVKNSHIQIDKSKQKAVLVIDQKLDVAWPRVMDAIKKAGLVIDDEHKTKGFLFVRDKAQTSGYDYTVYVYDYETGGKLFGDWGNWKNFFKSKELEQTHINIFNENGQRMPLSKTKTLLSDIQRHL